MTLLPLYTHIRALACTQVRPQILIFFLTVWLQTDLPFSHPAAGLEDLSPALRPYDTRLNPGCLQRTFQQLSYVSTSTGRIVACLNSSVGVRATMLDILLWQNVLCRCCLCMFSLDGYAGHLSGSRCNNMQSSTSGLCPITFFHYELIRLLQQM